MSKIKTAPKGANYLVVLLFFIGGYSIFSNETESDLLKHLEEQILCKQVYQYFEKNELQKHYWGPYKLYGKNGLYPLEDAFGIISQSNQKVFKDIQFVESYKYYGINITVHKLSNRGTNYYIAIADIITDGKALHFYLFSETGKFLDAFAVGSRYKDLLYEYRELTSDSYCILVLVNSTSLYFYIIDNDKFKDVFGAQIIRGSGNIFVDFSSGTTENTRACHKKCVNDQKMVKLPEEKVWSWHGREQIAMNDRDI